METKRARGKSVNPFERAMLNLFVYKLRRGKNVLSLGCGIGIPYEQFLAMLKCVVTGVDPNKANLVQAMLNLPTAKLVCGNILEYEPTERYNGMLLIDAHYYLPKEKHLELFKKAFEMLSEDGVLLVTVPPQQNFGEDKLADYYDFDTTLRFLKESGFDLIVSEAQTTYGVPDDMNWVLMRKHPSNTQQMLRDKDIQATR